MAGGRLSIGLSWGTGEPAQLFHVKPKTDSGASISNRKKHSGKLFINYNACSQVKKGEEGSCYFRPTPVLHHYRGVISSCAS